MIKTLNSEKLPIKLWLKDIEEGALRQAKNLANLPFAFHAIAIMPDCHEGFGMPIGGVMATNEVIIPNAVGVDIGCGMMAVKTSLTDIDILTLKRIMGRIRQIIPLGFQHHRCKQEWNGFNSALDIPIIQQELDSAKYQLGTLGGGNHFIEIQKGDDNHIGVMLHSGSRNFGLKTAEQYNKQAIKICENKYPEIIKQELSFLDLGSDIGQEYLRAMNYCLDFAKANRELMMNRILEIFKEETNAVVLETVNIHHNYAVIEKHFGKQVVVHRKGATLATAGLAGIIPGSMGSASYIVSGLGNPESFFSCSHGAGRRISRSQARQTLKLEEEQQKMIGIVHGLRSVSELDEAPGSYKNIDEVMANQQDLVKILVKLRPLAVIKG